jgi:phytoene dehydrogenase-like protein
MARPYDAVIVGGGHNGLVTAAYLAAAGWSVLVLERRPLVGGACVTEEIHPRHRVSTTSYLCSLLNTRIIRDLRLGEHGLEILPCSSSFTPFADGRSLLLGLGPAEDAEQIARFSRRDAESYPAFNAALLRIADALRPALAARPPDLLRAGPGDLWEIVKMGRRVRALAAPDRALLLKMLTMSAADLLDEWFESPPLKASLGATGTIGVYGSPRTPGTAFVLLHYQLGEAAGSPGAWGFARGGMGSIAEAIASAARARGATIRTGAPVQRIRVRRGAAEGVVLQDGEEIAARVVVSNADPKRTFLGLMDRSDLPAEFVRGIENLRCRGNSGKINLALSGRPEFRTLPGDGAHLRGSIQVCGSDPADLEKAFAEFESGVPSRHPYLEVTIPSTLDDTLAPAGHHVMSISIKFVPYRLAEGDWRARREELGDLAVGALAEHAPNLPSLILHRQVLTPLDFEEVYGLTGGNICHGEMALDQLFSMRPLPGWAGYRTPVGNLYLCGAGTHPGGGVMGDCGRNAARAILADRRRAWRAR